MLWKNIFPLTNYQNLAKEFQGNNAKPSPFRVVQEEEGYRGFKLSFTNLSLDVLQQIEDFLGNEKEAFLKHPEIYEEIPYSTKIAVKTPKRKRPANFG